MILRFPRKYSHAISRGLCALCLVALFALGGCVSKGKFNDLAAERDALNARVAELNEGNAILEAQLDEAETEAVVLEQQMDEQKSTMTRAQATYERLVDELEGEVAAGEVAIELMKSGVNVRISEDILFSSGSASLSSEGQAVVGRLGEELQSIPYQVVVGGYTDNVPIGGTLSKTYPSNWDLAGARASQVVRVLEGSGVPNAQLLAVSFGETNPVASNETPEGRSQNRRIEVRLRPVTSESDTPAVGAGPPR